MWRDSYVTSTFVVDPPNTEMILQEDHNPCLDYNLQLKRRKIKGDSAVMSQETKQTSSTKGSIDAPICPQTTLSEHLAD